MERSQSLDRPRRISFLTLALITAALYFGQDVLIPLALAILITFILTPLVQRLQAMRLGRVPATLLVVVLVFGGFSALAWSMGRQLVSFADTLPRYQQNIRTKVAFLRGGGSAALRQAQQAVEHLREDLGVATPTPPPPAPGAHLGGKSHGAPSATASAPLPVTVVEPPETPLTVLQTTLLPLLSPLGTAGLVIVFVIFMLIQREDLRDRFLRLLGEGRLNASTQALDEAAQRVSRYLLMQSLINTGTGTAVGLGLFLIGVPNALLWGLFAAVLRFIPYLGPWIAATLPTLISLAVFPGWEKPLLTIVLFLAIELVSNNVVEPLVYGSETGVSTLGILVSAVFWTWLWGPVGLLMATPLTVCLVVIGRYVPQLQFLNVLLGDQPPLPLEAQIYHRLLALDAEEVDELLEGALKGRTVAELYDGVLIPALSLAERDRHRGELSPEREELVGATLRNWIEDISTRPLEDGSLGAEPIPETAPRLVCVPSQDLADELVAHMLAHLAAGSGEPPPVLEHDLSRPEVLSRLAELGAEQVFLSVLAPYSYAQVRELCRDLRAHFPGLRIVVALWDPRAEAERYRRRLAAVGADEVVATLQEAMHALWTAPARASDPAVLAGELGRAFREEDLPRAEALLDEAGSIIPVETLVLDVLRPALAALRRDVAAGWIDPSAERLAHGVVRDRLAMLEETAAPQGPGYRALAVPAPGEEPETGQMILTLLMQQGNWSVVHLAQLPDEGLEEAVASVQPHAILFSAALAPGAGRLLGLADELRREHPEILFVLDGAGFRPSAVTRLGGAALLAGADVRKTLAAIERRLPPMAVAEGETETATYPSTHLAL